MPNGHTICLPYLAALIRLTDEIDVTAARNPGMLYDIESISDELERYYHVLHQICEALIIEKNAFVMVVRTKDPEFKGAIKVLRDKIEVTLDLCRTVVQERTPFVITQQRVEIQWLP